MKNAAANWTRPVNSPSLRAASKARDAARAAYVASPTADTLAAYETADAAYRAEVCATLAANVLTA